MSATKKMWARRLRSLVPNITAPAIKPPGFVRDFIDMWRHQIDGVEKFFVLLIFSMLGFLVYMVADTLYVTRDASPDYIKEYMMKSDCTNVQLTRYLKSASVPITISVVRQLHKSCVKSEQVMEQRREIFNSN